MNRSFRVVIVQGLMAIAAVDQGATLA